MKHELEDQLKAFEKKGIDRRHFFKLMAMAGLLTAASTQKAKAFSSKAKGKIVSIAANYVFTLTKLQLIPQCHNNWSNSFKSVI